MHNTFPLFRATQYWRNEFQMVIKVAFLWELPYLPLVVDKGNNLAVTFSNFQYKDHIVHWNVFGINKHHCSREFHMRLLETSAKFHKI
jgi:hypothetical protein